MKYHTSATGCDAGSTCKEPKALMVRWSQVSLAAGYLVELRPVVHGVPGGTGLMWEALEDAKGRCQLIHSQLNDFIEQNFCGFMSSSWISVNSLHQSKCIFHRNTLIFPWLFHVFSSAWSSVDVAAGSLEKGSKLPPGLLGPQCSACRVNKLKEVPYEARDLAKISWRYPDPTVVGCG